MKLTHHRSRTVESTLRWQKVDYAVLGVFFVWAWTVHDTEPFVWGWPVMFAFYVWGNVYSVKSAYAEGYADGTIDTLSHANHDQHRGD